MDTRKPNLFLVGAPKCGTTAMTSYLREHPDIYIPRGKEFHYFGKDLNSRGLFGFIENKEKYLALFESATDEKIIGESSVWYLYSEHAAREIHEFNPDAKIIAMLRNPIQMLYSQHSQWVYNASEPLEDFEAALAAEEDRKNGERIPETAIFVKGLFYREIARYSEQLKRYFKHFGRDQVHVIIFDDFKKNTGGVYKETLKFLGVAPDFTPKFERVNPNKEVRSKLLNKIARHPPDWLGKPINYFVKKAPNIVRQTLLNIFKFINTRYTDRPPLSKDVQKKLSRDFEGEVKQLSELLDRNLTHWLEID